MAHGAVHVFRSPAEHHRLRAIVSEHSRALARYLAREGVPSAELDDALQEVFLVVAAKLPVLPADAERAYLFATAFRVACNARRGQHRRERTRDGLMLVPDDPRPGADQIIDDVSARALLEDALDDLPNDARLVFVLSEVHEMPLARIAERLGLPGGTVASRLRRARQQFESWRARASAAAAFDEARPRPPAGGSGGRARDAENGEAVGPRPEVMSWWVTHGEVEALRALVRVYQRAYPNAAVSATSAAATGAVNALKNRLTRGVPPDTFQVNAGTDLFTWVRRGRARDRLEPIDALFSADGWRRAFPADVLDLLTHDGRRYAVPLDIHRTNALFFNRHVLADHGLAPPSTLDELHFVAAALSARGVTPFAFGYKHPWTLTLLAFENLLVAVAGGVYYRAFFSGSESPDDPEIRAALVHAARILSCSNADAAELTWDGAVERVRTGRAAMTIMGDWAKGYLLNCGSAPGRDFGQRATPGTGASFIFCIDAFGLPKCASHRASAIDLLRVFGSREGQDAFNPVKGSTPPRVDADFSGYDALARATAHDFQTGARYPSVASLAPAAFRRALDSAMIQFARSRDPEAFVTAIRPHYDLLAR